MKKTPTSSKKELVLAVRRDLSAGHAELIEDVRETLAAGQNKNTERAFKSDIEHFFAWCSAQGFISCPANPPTICMYITSLAKGHADAYGKRKISTIRRRMASIARVHTEYNLVCKNRGNPEVDDPTKSYEVHKTWKSLRREFGTRTERKRALLREESIRCVRSITGEDLLAYRNRSLLRFGGESAERRSEIVDLKVEDLRFIEGGVIVTLLFSKSNQEGELEQIMIPIDVNPDTCPVTLLRAWLDRSGITTGYVFQGIQHGRLTGQPLTGNDVARIVKEAVARTGIGDPRHYAGHSLRAGYATSEARDGKTNRQIRQRTRHKNDAIVNTYVREGEMLAEALEAARRRKAGEQNEIL